MSDKHIARDVLVELYYNQLLSAPQIADRLSRERGVSISDAHVYNMMRSYGLERRTPEFGSKMAHRQGRTGHRSHSTLMSRTGSAG